MGKAVLCGGKARYTQYPMVFFPQSPIEYRQQLEEFLVADAISVPPEFRDNARRFLYYQLFKASLSFEDFLMEGPRKGFVGLKPFSWKALRADNSPTIKVLEKGLNLLIGQDPGIFSAEIDIPPAYTFLFEDTQ